MFVRVAPETGLFQAGGLAIDDDWDYAIGGPPTRLGDLLPYPAGSLRLANALHCRNRRWGR